jgi:hypothetical protein
MKVAPRLPAMVRGLVQPVDSALVRDAPTARAIQLAAHRVGYDVGEVCPVAPPAPRVEPLAGAVVHLSRVRPEATWRGAADARHAREAAKGVGHNAAVRVGSS